MSLKANEKLDLAEILRDLQNYRPKRKGWTWRNKKENLSCGAFSYRQCSEPLDKSWAISIPNRIV